MDALKGIRTELLVALAIVAMVCVTILVGLDKIKGEALIAAVPGTFAALGAYTAAARASRAETSAADAHGRLDDKEDQPRA